MSLAWFPTLLAAFLAAFVEGVEALTVVLAAGITRGWTGALTGAAAACATLAALVWALGDTLGHLPIRLLQLGVGALLLSFGLRWLAKAVRRAAGTLRQRDEDAAFSRARAKLATTPPSRGWDWLAFTAAAQICLLEGAEIVVIVTAMRAGGPTLVAPAWIGAALGVLCVVTLGALLHRPLTQIPENTIKLAVGILLPAFGIFWLGEAADLPWPGGDLSLPALIALSALTTRFVISSVRARG